MEKKKIIVIAAGTVVCVAALGASYMYNESTKSKVAFTPVESIEYGDSLETLFTVEKADSHVFYLADEDGNTVETPAVNVPYTLVVEATSNGKPTIYTLENVVFSDSKAPEISVENENITVEYGAEYDLGAKAVDAVDGEVDVVADTEIDTKKPGEYTINLSAEDASGNEAAAVIKVTVKEPACAENAAWNGEDCVCNEGYNGDGWTACALVPKPTVKPAAASYNNTSSGTAQSWNNNTTETWNNNSSWDNGNTWSDNSSANTWTELAQNGGNTGSGNTAVNGWEIDLPTDQDTADVWKEGYDLFGEGVGWGGWVTSDGTRFWD